VRVFYLFLVAYVAGAVVIASFAITLWRFGA